VGPSTARWELQELLLEDLRAPRSAADGGGSFRLLEGGPARVGEAGTWRFVFETGPLGVAEGGALYLQISPWWGWSPPQTSDPERPGFCVIEADKVAEGAGLRFEARDLGGQILAIRPFRDDASSGSGGALVLSPGDRVLVTYGAGPLGATADRFAERAPGVYMAVDGDGDGVRKLLEEAPELVTLPGDGRRLVAFLPSVARPGDHVRLRVSLLDANGNAGVPETGSLLLQTDEGLSVPSESALHGRHEGHLEIPVEVRRGGVHRVHARLRHLEPDSRESHVLEVVSNPMLVAASAPSLLWGDIHAHSTLSDGSAAPEDLYRYARDIAGLDFAAITDHDHWGMHPLDRHPALWQRIREATIAADEVGRFTALLGYEWTSWVFGHRHVVSFEDPRAPDTLPSICSSLDPTCDNPEKLRSHLAGRRNLVVPHHPAGGPVAVHLDRSPDPLLEPLVEVASVHGLSESPELRGRIYAAVQGHFARDLLDAGHHFGFAGGGDGHDGHPGLSGIAGPMGGLIAVLGASNTRESLHEAILARRVYATNGPRILLFATLAGRPMGSEVPLAEIGPGALRFLAETEGLAERVELLQRGHPPRGIACEERHCDGVLDIEAAVEGDWIYLRVLQRDGGVAFSSPFFVTR
jgi:hypothetical protein